MGTGGEAGNQSFRGLEDKISWVEKFVRVGASGMEAAQDEHSRHAFIRFRPALLSGFKLAVVPSRQDWSRARPASRLVYSAGACRVVIEPLPAFQFMLCIKIEHWRH